MLKQVHYCRAAMLMVASVFVISFAHAQYTIKGVVVAEGDKRVAHAGVQLLNSNRTVITDREGNFSFDQVAGGKQVFRVSALGYASVNTDIEVTADQQVTIRLVNVRNRLDEAVVTALKAEQDPQNIPVSLSVVNADKIQDQNIWNVMDIATLVPNLYIAHSGDNRNVASVRGIATTSYDQAVATYVDGVSQFNLDTYIPYLQDVERIEVLRGPQSMLYGRNAMGGVINVVTRKPGNTVSGSAEMHFGNYGQQRYQLALRAPVIADKLFLGVSGLFNKLDGFYTNEFNDSDYDKQHTVLGSYFLTYLPTDKWSLTLNVKHAANRNNGAFPLVMGMAAAKENPFKLSQNALTKMKDNTANVSLSVKHYGEKLDFTSQTAYQTNHRYYTDPIDGDFSPLDAVSVVNNYGKDWNNVQVLTQELRLSSPRSVDSRLDWTGGTYLFYQDNPTRQGTYYGQDAALMGAPMVDFTSILTNKSYVYGASFFGQLGYAIAPKLHVTGGLRYDHEQLTQVVLGEFQAGDSPAVVTSPRASADATFSAFSPSASLRYQVADRNQVYVSYNKGFRAGGLSPLSSDPEKEPALRQFKPEYSDNIEIGSKNRFLNERIQLNIAAFFSAVNHVQVPVLLMPDAITVTQNTGNMESKGIELELAAKALPNLDIWYNIGYTHARYTDLNAVDDDANIQLKGNRPVYTPDVTSSLGIQYKYPIGRHQLQVGGQWKYIGQHYFDVANTLKQTDYSLIHANVGYTFKHVSLIVWGQNITDARYASYAYDFGAVHLGRPATYGVTLRKVFGQ